MGPESQVAGRAQKGLLELLLTCCHSATAIVQGHYKTFVSTGSRLTESIKEASDPRTLVTEADILTEREISSLLQGELGCSVLSEELGAVASSSDGGYRAIIDPLDGSKNFAQGTLGLFGVSVALERSGSLVAGAIGLPFFKEILAGEAGRGGVLVSGDAGQIEELRLPNRAPVSLSNARVCLGRGAAPAEVLISPPLSCILSLANEAVNFASCTVGLASVILGRIDALVLPQQRYWDFAAGLFLIQQLGGKFGVWVNGWRQPVADPELASATADSSYNIAATLDASLFRELVEELGRV